METYGRQLGAEPECTEEPSRALDRIRDMAERAERTANSVQRFVDRFHGNPSPVRSLEEAKQLPPPGYAAQLDRLGKTLERLNDLANSLCEIG